MFLLQMAFHKANCQMIVSETLKCQQCELANNLICIITICDPPNKNQPSDILRNTILNMQLQKPKILGSFIN